MPDELMDRLSAIRPDVPNGLLEPDTHLLEEILMIEVKNKRVVTQFRLASIAAVAAALVGLLLALPNNATTKTPTRSTLNMRAIVESTPNALSSGRAHVVHQSKTDKVGPAPRTSGADFIVEFNGDNRSMYGTIDPGDGRSSAFSIANKVVDHHFYLQDGTRWVEDTNANLSGADVFSVDPRNFLAGVATAAQFEQVGHARVDGVDTRHLRATRVDGIPDFNLGMGPRGNDENKLTAFELWVDGDDVVRGLLVKTSERQESYAAARANLVKDATGNRQKLIDPATLGEPEIITTTTSYKVTFSDLGQDIAITAPPGAAKIAGKG
jgi:hypothetical protein